MHCGPAPKTWSGAEEGEKVKRSSPPGAMILRPAPFNGVGTAISPQRATALTQAGVEAVQSIIAPMMNEFAAMQQQMFDQFQESMFMLAKMFRSVNQEQMKEIHEELEQIRELTYEMKNLQEQLNAKEAPVPNVTQPDPAVNFSAIPSTGDGSIDLLLSALTMTEPTAPANNPVFEPSLRDDALSNGGASPPLAQPVARPVAHSETAETTDANTVPPAPPPTNGVAHSTEPAEPPIPPMPKITASAVPPGVDLHGWLTDRLSSIQTERQSRMQKILGMLTGKRGSGNPVP
jgi:hypothetical protein